MLMLVAINMVSSAKRFVRVPGVEGMSFMYAMNSIGERQDPWGTPAIGVRGVEKSDPTRTEYVLSEMNDCTSLTSEGGTCSWSSLCSSPSCHTLSNAFSKSRNAAAVLSSRFIVLARWSITFVSWLVVECCDLKAYWSGRIEVDMTFFRLIRIIISRTLAIELMSAIGRWLLGFLRSFPAFGIIITVAAFQGVGKCWYLRQQLNILVSARMVLSEK